MKSSPLREAIFLNTAALGQSYQLVADLMQARVQAKGAEDRTRMLEARQLWFDAVFEDRNKGQLVMEYQQRMVGDPEPQLALLFGWPVALVAGRLEDWLDVFGEVDRGGSFCLIGLRGGGKRNHRHQAH